MIEYTLEISPAAERKLNQAFHYYQEKSPGLGIAFLEELDECLKVLVRNPLIYRIRFDQVRRVNLKRFPYAVFYEVVANVVFVNQIIHGSSNPEYWGA